MNRELLAILALGASACSKAPDATPAVGNDAERATTVQSSAPAPSTAFAHRRTAPLPDPWLTCWRTGWEACRTQTEATVFQRHPGLAHRRANELVLRLQNGDSAIVRDTVTEGPGSYIYWLHDFDERSGYFIVGMNGYENRGSIVINRRNGWRKDLDFDFPLFSTDSRFAALTVPLLTAYWEPTIEIYAVGPDSLISDFHLAGRTAFARGDTAWGPTDPYWLGHDLHFSTEWTIRGPDGWPGDSMMAAKEQSRWQLHRLK